MPVSSMEQKVMSALVRKAGCLVTVSQEAECRLFDDADSEARTPNCACEQKPSEADDVVDSDVYSVVEEPAYSLAGDHDEAVAKAFGLS